MIQRYRLLFLVSGCLLTFSASSQDFIYKAGFFGFFDNREYFNDYITDQTITGTRISAEAGYSFQQNSRIMVGLDYLYEFGSKGEWVAPDIIAYYHGRYKNAGMYLGAFPRLSQISMPLALLSDTLQYFRPTVEGILLDYRTQTSYNNIWIDWEGRQSYTKQEKFLLGFSGYFKRNILVFQHHFIMTHLAHSKKTGVEEHIRDNAAITLLPGFDLSGTSVLDSLTIHAGLLASYDRLRGIYGFRFAEGFLGQVNVLYRNTGFQGTVYTGEGQIITSGDGFYKSDFYARMDFSYRVVKPWLNSRVQISLHFIPGVVDLSMALVVRASLDGRFGHHQSN